VQRKGSVPRVIEEKTEVSGFLRASNWGGENERRTWEKTLAERSSRAGKRGKERVNVRKKPWGKDANGGRVKRVGGSGTGACGCGNEKRCNTTSGMAYGDEGGDGETKSAIEGDKTVRRAKAMLRIKLAKAS